MPAAKRPSSEPTDDWQQLQLLTSFPEQRAYELLRPVVLFGRSAAERAGETGTAERTLYRRAARFDAEGMASLFPPPQTEKHRRLLARIRAAIHDLHAEHPAFYASEIAAICAIRFDHRPSPHTVRRILAEGPPPLRLARRFPPYRDIAEPAAARLAIIRLHSEGWAVKSIAAYPECSRQQVYRTLRRWIAEGVAGLDDKSRARADVPRAVTFRAIATVKELQENPRLGEFRIHAALRQQGIYLSPRTCGRILLSIHKAQGAEFPAVVIPLVTAHAALLGRTLLYTAFNPCPAGGRDRRAAEGAIDGGAGLAAGAALHRARRPARRDDALRLGARAGRRGGRSCRRRRLVGGTGRRGSRAVGSRTVRALFADMVRAPHRGGVSMRPSSTSERRGGVWHTPIASSSARPPPPERKMDRSRRGLWSGTVSRIEGPTQGSAIVATSRVAASQYQSWPVW
jgi:transposase